MYARLAAGPRRAVIAATGQVAVSLSTPTAPSVRPLVPEVAGLPPAAVTPTGAPPAQQAAAPQIYDSSTPPTNPVYPYLRIVRDEDGDITQVYVGT